MQNANRGCDSSVSEVNASGAWDFLSTLRTPASYSKGTAIFSPGGKYEWSVYLTTQIYLRQRL